MRQLGLHQTENLPYNKENNQQSEKQPMEWGNIVANHNSDEGYISKMYGELITPNSKNK